MQRIQKINEEVLKILEGDPTCTFSPIPSINLLWEFPGLYNGTPFLKSTASSPSADMGT